jgi:hypothetical protein
MHTIVRSFASRVWRSHLHPHQILRSPFGGGCQGRCPPGIVGAGGNNGA